VPGRERGEASEPAPGKLGQRLVLHTDQEEGFLPAAAGLRDPLGPGLAPAVMSVKTSFSRKTTDLPLPSPLSAE